MEAGVGELLFPRHCAGCKAAGAVLCARCREELATPPARVFPGTNPHVPVFAFGPYAGAHRGVVLAMKEKRNLAVRRHVGAVLAAGLDYLEARGELPPGAGLVPAPTRAASARARGGDPVEAVCRATLRPTYSVLSLDDRVADQAQLGAEQRRANLSGAVRIRGVPTRCVVVVDDVVTTGATLQASVEKLLASGGEVAACVALCAA
ncbi:DNA utilization protein GntX [Corynebacterium capitovis DSM 44611]|uniref:ComF family protein n=1 Tax=Corynebacterium capitovis TaxID=131081 RepID=UPI000363B509|nr:phosphoribosyltransferase family protein [Corynebacterium capitovis]WKD57038.1 DNA utilization protein GntX [Corynebacterium capitovis DSM 44611]